MAITAPGTAHGNKCRFHRDGNRTHSANVFKFPNPSKASVADQECEQASLALVTLPRWPSTRPHWNCCQQMTKARKEAWLGDISVLSTGKQPSVLLSTECSSSIKDGSDLEVKHDLRSVLLSCIPCLLHPVLVQCRANTAPLPCESLKPQEL